VENCEAEAGLLNLLDVLGSLEYINTTTVIALGHFYCNAITPMIGALFGPYVAMFVNRIYPGKSLNTRFVSPGKPWNLVFASPGKQYFTV